MKELPPDPLIRSFPPEPTWRSILVSYVMMAAVPLTLWVVGSPLVRGSAIAAVALAVVGARRAATLARCLRECGAFAFDVAGRVEIRVARPGVEDAN